MPVRKFRSAADMPRPTATPLDPCNLDRALAISALCAALAPRRIAPGVYRHRSVEEAFQQRLAWQADRIESAARRARSE
jgi:hypothetical protein